MRRTACLSFVAALLVPFAEPPVSALSAQRPAFAEATAGRPSAETKPYLDAAIEAGKWIRGSAVKTPAGLAWPADPADPDSANTSLYGGFPGVVLFLLELHHATGNGEYLKEARLGADELMAGLPKETEAGLYTGASGIGFALGEIYRATNDTKYRDAVRAIVRTLNDRAKPAGSGVQWSDITDIIGGSAGVGLFLLYAHETVGDDAARALAVRAADRLIELGQPEHGGLFWAMDPKFPRKMPNFSHGTAGIAYFLTAVYDATREKKYLDAALAGARYLQAIAKTEGDICLIPHNQPDGLDLYYLGWCHGPTGTARLWYRLAKSTGEASWMEWVGKSARAIARSGIPETRTPGFWNNVSQCCGSAGVAQFFLDLSGVTKDPQYLDFSKRMTADLLARATRDEKGLRWVQAEHRVRPELLVAQTGYMQGAAGIGMWLLRLDAAERGKTPFVRFPDTPF
jgi:lantibiotic modifying enzyme